MSSPAPRPWWTRSSSKNSETSLQSSSSSSTKPSTLKSARSLTSLKRDDSAAIRKPESQKQTRRSSPSSSKFNTLASAIGLKAKKPAGPTLAIQDPPSLLPETLPETTPPPVPSPAPSQVSHNTRSYTNRHPASSISSAVPSLDDAEPRTPSDAPSTRERSSYQHSIFTLSDTDPFASRGIVIPAKVQIQDPLRLSVFSDGSNASSTDLHQKKGGPEPLNRASFASGSSSSQSHTHSTHQQPGELPSTIAESPQNVSNWREGGMPNRLSEPPSNPLRSPHLPPMRARGMTDVGPSRIPSSGASSPSGTGSPSASTPGSPSTAARHLVVVRQASIGRIHSRPAAPPPPIPIPLPPLPSVSPIPPSGNISDASGSTLKDKARQIPSPSSYHTAVDLSSDGAQSENEDLFSQLPLTPLVDEDDSSGSSLSFASSMSETRDVVANHGNVWSPRERDFSRHGKRGSKSIDKGKGKMKASEEQEEQEWVGGNLRNQPSRTTIVPSTPDYPPVKTVKKALSQQSMNTAMSPQRFSVASTVSMSSAHSSGVDDHNTGQDKISQLKGKGKPPKKQRSFHHPRIPLPPLPHLRPSQSNAGGTSSTSHNHADSTTSTITDQRKGSTPTTTFASFPSLSISTSSNEKNLDKPNSSPARPHTPVRKRLFSGSNLRRTPSSQAHSPSEEDKRSVFSLTMESENRSWGSYANPMSPNESVASFWDDGDTNGGHTGAMSPRPQPDYVPQQIMSPADMLRLEAMVQQEQEERASREHPRHDDRARRDSVQSTPSLTVHHAPDSAHAEDFGFARLSSSYMSVSASTGRPRGNSQTSSMSGSTTSMSLNMPSTGIGQGWHHNSPSGNDPDGPSSPPSAASSPRFWDRVMARDGGPHSPQKHTSNSRTAAGPSPLSPYSQAFKPSRSASMAKSTGPLLHNVRPSTSQSDMSPPTSPSRSSFLVSPAAGAPIMLHSPSNSLPPPPRRRPRTSSAIATTGSSSVSTEPSTRQRHVSEVASGPLPPPRRLGSQRSTRSPYPPPASATSPRRTIIRKPSFLDIEDEAEPPPDAKPAAKPFDENFLDLGRGKDSFDTVRSVDILELVGPG
ncbi:hypothetical protein NEOLEDRAFT_1166195 [Neolentinus lepideus HHB14362 ss-1]|uniref:Uncharacterized protein n=1 Tax=Neolentinus lepideus HHB14362 ss-1 TaxID=1314782 RepID=A0A165W907_9AGAM|nr:hypothetical protein NEOLEDRAFT_1166195 [Neolentinus lepideus HHB14362 ss-1]